MVQERYPVQYTGRDTDSGEQVRFTFQRPRRNPRTAGPAEIPGLIQEFDLVVTADEDDAVELAELTLDGLVACLSFATRRPVDWSISPITERETNSGRQPKSLFPVRHAETLRAPVGLTTVDPNRVLSGIGDIRGKRGRKIIRAIRWLYRSRGTQDRVEMFSFLAMAYAALTPLLPSPANSPTSRLKRGKGLDPAGGRHPASEGSRASATGRKHSSETFRRGNSRCYPRRLEQSMGAPSQAVPRRPIRVAE